MCSNGPLVCATIVALLSVFVILLYPIVFPSNMPHPTPPLVTPSFNASSWQLTPAKRKFGPSIKMCLEQSADCNLRPNLRENYCHCLSTDPADVTLASTCFLREGVRRDAVIMI